MNKLILALAIALPFTAQAAKEAPTDHDICKSRSDLARNIMELRQKNIPMTKILAVFGTEQKWIKTVKDAYSQPRWSYKALQASATNEFADEYYLECIRSFEGEK